jgi:uncharacterized repeat protein (TIGR03943 family)
VRANAGSVLLFVVGAVVLQQAVFGGYLDYVKPAQGPWLIAAGLVLVALGVVGMLTGDALDEREESSRQARLVVHTHGPLAAAPEVIAHARRERREVARDDHYRTPGVAALLVLPLVMVLGVSPPPLGAFTAARSGAAVPAPISQRGYSPLPVGNPTPLAVHDYAERAAWDGGRTLGGRTVTLTGFVTPDGDARWYLSRIMITCCAADSRSYLVAIDGGGRPPVVNSWQQVTGTWVASPPASDGRPTARLAATTVTPAATPVETYELP